MASDGDAADGADGQTVPSVLLDVLEDPGQGESRLPYLLSLVDEDHVGTRLAASSALCAVVQANTELLEYVVRRLVDRLDESAPTEVVHTLDYLAAEFPREVDEVLADIEEEAQETARTRMYRTGGGYARNDYMNPTDPEGHSARARLPESAVSGADDPRLAYTGDDEDDRRPHADAEPDGDGEDDGDDEDISDGTLTRSRATVLSERLSRIVENSQFESLDILAARHARRYAEVYRALGTVNGDARALGLHVCHVPDGGSESFVDAFRETMTRWADADDHDGIHTVYDWGWHPRPWVAVEYTGLRLDDRDDISVREGLWNGLKLATTLSYLHQRGFIHGAIDPQNVAYVGDVLGGTDRQAPLLTNVGLLDIYRPYDDPVDYLDPRYAAPEYFDDRHGRIDHLTDVYQFGTVLYRLLTGNPPYEGELSAIREAVLHETPTPPSTVNPEIPPVLDEPVLKATATEKIARYESIEHLQQELYSVVDSPQSDGD